MLERDRIKEKEENERVTKGQWRGGGRGEKEMAGDGRQCGLGGRFSPTA